MLTDLYTRRALVWAFASRDIKTRYRTSILGWGWSLLQPLATLVIFAAVFSMVFRVQAPPLGNGEGSSYAAYLFTGIVTWNLFSSFLTLSMTQLRISGELLKKVQFPGWAPVLGASIVQLVQVALEMLVLMGLFVWQGNIGWTWLLAVPILLATALFAQGIGLMLAILNARFGDVQFIVTVLLGAFYFLTPILYPISMVNGQNEVLSAVVRGNPMTWFVQSMHDVMYSLTAPTWWVIPGLLLVGFLTFWIGFSVFNRTSENLGEYL